MSDFFLWVESLDMAAGFLLAAAASCRGRLYGGHISGSAVLGCLCGLAGPLLRESLLHGPDGVKLILYALPGAVLAGALTGALLGGVRNNGWLFFWLDGLSLGLAACLGTVCGMSGLGVTGALILGLLAGLAPGLLRDMALGDTARVVEESWYATAAALGCMLTIFLVLLPSWGQGPWPLSDNQWKYVCILSGALLVLILRFRRGRGSPD